jgi:hypothetical protein
MFEKISNAAEKLATKVSESRRGFLARVGQGALGVAGVLAGVLALPAKGQAVPVGGYCQVVFPGSFNQTRGLTGYCVNPLSCLTRFNPTQCSGFGSGIIGRCGSYMSSFRSCTVIP